MPPASSLIPPRSATPILRHGAVWGALALAAVGFAIYAVATDPYRRKPSPDGMVLRIAFGEVEDPLRRVVVMPAVGGRSAFWIVNPFATEGEAAVLEVEYPSGESNEVVLDRLPGLPATPLFFDLDGDRVEDRIPIGDGPEADRVQVHCGAAGGVLFENLDPFGYATRDRAFPLGDLDGDGCGELALVHPRENRNDYDVHPGDWIFGVSSWVTVISGSRLTL